MRNDLIRTAIITILLSTISGVTLAFEELGKIKLASAEQPAPSIPGSTVHWLKNGEEYSWTIYTVEDDIQTGEDSTGCKWSALDSTWAPSFSWENCNGSTGTQKITKSKGSAWPMAVKTKFSFNFRGRDQKGGTWTGYRRCKVKSAVKVQVPAGEYDTYKIICSVDWETLTFWYSPELEMVIAKKRKHKYDRSKNYIQELVKIEMP